MADRNIAVGDTLNKFRYEFNSTAEDIGVIATLTGTSGIIADATDVIEDEYGNRNNSPILNGIKKGLNIIVTPHVGGMTWEGQQRAYEWSINKLEKLK